MTLGIISDTHGLLRTTAVDALRGVDQIIHAGDIGPVEILDELRRIAPTVVVRGNVDTEPWACRLPAADSLATPGGRIYILHNLQELPRRPAPAGTSVIVSGHTHQPVQRVSDGLLYLNPGSAGPRRFKLPISLARLVWTGEAWETEFLTLES